RLERVASLSNMSTIGPRREFCSERRNGSHVHDCDGGTKQGAATNRGYRDSSHCLPSGIRLMANGMATSSMHPIAPFVLSRSECGGLARCTQAARSLPQPVLDPQRRWRELDSSMSSDALLMNIFRAPDLTASAGVRNALGVEGDAQPEFGWKARVPLRDGRVDRTEVDMLWGSLMVEAKLTESDFQSREARIVEAYRDFEEVFDRELLPRIQISTSRPRRVSEFPENVLMPLQT